MRHLSSAITQLNTIILGKEAQLRLALACLLARGHLLIEDIPGVGKTTLAHALAHTLGLDFQRIQFTSDMLPADIIGVSIYDREVSAFTFHPGPIFASVILADEINRATPKTQSALLEAMEEQQVTQDGVTHSLPSPFFVIATQNPASQVGTFSLPESQLDRFLMRISLGYPGRDAERALLGGEDRRGMIGRLPACLNAAGIDELQQAVRGVHASSALLDYVQALLSASREASAFVNGLSPRAGLALLNAARAWALLADRTAVLPEDIQAVWASVAGHRLLSATGLSATPEQLTALLRSVAIP